MNKHRNKCKANREVKYRLKENNRKIDDPQEVVEIFSKHFDTGSVAADKTNSSDSITLLNKYSPKVIRELRWKKVTPVEVKRLVLGMESKNSSGWDDIPITVIKQNIDILAEPLSNTFNFYFTKNIFPDNLKVAKVIPIFKKGSRDDVKNYRPISLLPTFSKLFERLIKVRLLDHFTWNNVLNKRQFGYQRDIGTVEAIDTLIDEVVTNLNKKKKVAGVFLDLSSAFDSINHDILLNKLSHYGVRHDQLGLIRSYLENRKQYVELNSFNGCEEIACKSEMVYHRVLYWVHCFSYYL